MNQRNLKGIKQNQTKPPKELMCEIQNTRNWIIDIKNWGRGIVWLYGNGLTLDLDFIIF